MKIVLNVLGIILLLLVKQYQFTGDLSTASEAEKSFFLSNNEDFHISPIYDNLKIITDEGIQWRKINNRTEIQLRKVYQTNEKYLLVFEYDLDIEGVACIISPNPNSEGEDDKFKILADYVLKGMPFILLATEIDLSDDEMCKIDKFVDDDLFVDGVLHGMDEIAKIFKFMTQNSISLKLLNSGQTHQFFEFYHSTGELTLNDFSSLMINEQAIDFMGDTITQFHVPSLKYEEIINFLNVVESFLIEKVNGLILDEVDGDETSSEYKEKLELLENHKPIYDEDDQGVTLGGELKKLFDKEKDQVIDFPSLPAELQKINSFVDLASRSKIVFPAALFYISKYFFESGQGIEDPSEIINVLSTDKPHSTLKKNYVFALKKLISNFFGVFHKKLEINNFREDCNQILDKYIDSISPYLEEVGFKGKPFPVKESLKNILKLVLYDEHIYVFFILTKFDDIINKSASFIEENDAAVFGESETHQLINEYMCLGFEEDEETTLYLDYQSFSTQFIRSRRRLLLD